MCYEDYYFEEPTRECLLDGKVVPYDACGTDKEECDKYYKERYKYIGSSNTYYINGVENNPTIEYHFYIEKPREAYNNHSLSH